MTRLQILFLALLLDAACWSALGWIVYKVIV